MPNGKQITIISPTKLQINWLAPTRHWQEVKHYKMTWKCLDCVDRMLSKLNERNILSISENNPDHLYSATIEDLQPGHSYQVTVASMNSRGSSEHYMYPVIKTKISVAIQPKNLHLVGIHKRARQIQSKQDSFGNTQLPYLCIELAWESPDELHTSQQISYQIFAQLVGPIDVINELNDPSNVGANIWGASTATNNNNNNLTTKPQLSYLILQKRLLANVTGNTFRSSESDHIGYGFTYLFEVALMNQTNHGATALLNVTTPDAPPSSSPLHVRLSGLASSAVDVSWAPPAIPFRNGIITGYEVRYFEVGAEAQTETSIKVTGSGQRQYTARGLKDKTFYTFMVRAFTSAGSGPWSGASNIRTSVELPPPPVEIMATRINQHQLKVTWRVQTSEDNESNSRPITIQGFRILYSANNNPYEAGQWTSFDVGPVNMAIISHLETKTSYVICIKAKGIDGRYGDCSQPVISRSTTMHSESEFSVRGLFCSGDDSSVKVTWQQPKRTEKLEGFKLRIGGSKKFADETGVIRRLEFPARSVSVAYAALHSGYTYTVSDLEPNSIYDVQVSAYYDLTLDMQSDWETTSCFTQMQRPPYVQPPIPVAASTTRLQVLLQLHRVSEQYGKIRQYFLIISPVHLADRKTDQISIDQTITVSRGLTSSETRYVAARFLQNFFEPPPRNSKNFTLGSYIQPQRRGNEEQVMKYTKRESNFNENKFIEDKDIIFDNKALILGQEYKAFVRACVFQEDQSIIDGPEACTSSDWSFGFGPDRQLPSWLEIVNNQNARKSLIGHNTQTTQAGFSFLGIDFNKTFSKFGNEMLMMVIISIIVGLSLLALLCLTFGCVIKRRRRHKLLTQLAPNDSTMKQPLIRMNEYQANNGNNFGLIPNGINLVNTNFCSTIDKHRDSINGHNSLHSCSLVAATSPGPMQPSLISSLSAGIRPDYMITSATSSPLTGINHQSTLVNMPIYHGYSIGKNDQLNSFINQRVGTMSSHNGSHPSSIIGSTGGVAHSTPGMTNYLQQNDDICDSLVIARNGMPGSEYAPNMSFDIQNHSFEIKGHPLHQSIPVHLLVDHVARLSAADNLLFRQEFESLSCDHDFTWEHSNLDVNKSKNRYANVIAYDHSRVVLQSIDCVSGSDYINANYIDGYKKSNCYIATQGPTADTFSDFWRMIWEQRVSIIVMMTRLEERSRVKCDQYWPSRGPESFAGGLIIVKPIDTNELAYYTIRTFHLTARGIEDECREIKHFQFTSWPDHGVPEYPISLLLFIRRVRATALSNFNNLIQPDQGPIVVHCSAGVGRTGAFIVIDIMLERLKYEKTLDIYGCVKSMRTQRNFMVQTEDQYMFIHSALLEAVEAGNTEVPARNLLAHLNKLNMMDINGGTGMELEFKKLAQFKMPNSKYTSAKLSCNKTKNRLLNILPYESTRVVLQSIRGLNGSDYINANFIDSYRERKAYIATQGPIAKTVEDFWRMVWETNSNIVVMLTNLTERDRECCYPYWPTERSSRYQYYVVDPIVEYNMPHYTLREFKLTDARDGQGRTLRQFQFTEWPEHGVPSNTESFIEFLGQVHKTKEQFGQDGPITVHCSAGVGRTGVFLTLAIVLERMRHEGIVDMFQTVRILRTQRPVMVQSEDQYKFCYRAALDYFSSFDHYST